MNDAHKSESAFPRANADGINKMEYFSAMAMMGLLANPTIRPLSREVDGVVIRIDEYKELGEEAKKYAQGILSQL